MRRPYPWQHHKMETAMDFEHSTKVRALQSRLQAFIAEHIYPSERRYQEEVRSGDRWQPTEVIEELKQKARAAGLWNLFLPPNTVTQLIP